MPETNNLALARTKAGMTQQQVADAIGVTLQAYQNYEYGKRDIKASVLSRLSKALSCSVNYLLGIDGDSAPASPPSYVPVPLFGRIAAGRPIEMDAADDTHDIPRRVRDRYPKAYLLRVDGESMNRVLPNGALALVDPRDEVTHPGMPYAVCVNGYDATIKRVRLLNNGIELDPDSDDPTFKPMVYDYGEEGTPTITVKGEVVWYCLPYEWDFRPRV